MNKNEEVAGDRSVGKIELSLRSYLVDLEQVKCHSRNISYLPLLHPSQLLEVLETMAAEDLPSS